MANDQGRASDTDGALKTNRRTLVKAASVSGLAAFAGCMGGDDGDVITYMNNGGVTHDADEELMEEWSAETGVEVEHHVEPTETGFLTYLEQNPGAIDLAAPGFSFLAMAVNEYGDDDPLLTELDFDRLPNYEENVREEWREEIPPLQEEMGTYSKAAFRYISSHGMVYNEEQVGHLERWDDLKDPDLEGLITLMAVGFLRYGVASQAIDEDINNLTSDDDEAEALFDRLSEEVYEQHQNVRNYWTSGDEHMQMYRNEAAYAGTGWGGRIRRMREEEGHDHLHFTHTVQGGVSAGELYVIPEASENKDHAYDLLNWLYQHDNIVELTEMNGYPLPIYDQPDWISELPDYADHPDDLAWLDWVNLPAGEINWFDRMAERFEAIRGGQWEP